MLHLLKIEWMKVKNYRTFWVLMILYFVSLYGISYISYRIQSARPKKDMMATALFGNPFEFPDVWHTVTYMCSFLLFIPGLLMIISFTNEYSFKTHRQNIIDGWSRRQFITVKMILAVILALLSTVAVFIIALAFGLFEGGVDLSFDKVEYVGYFFVQALSYSAVALLFSLLFRRAAIAVGVFFLYVTVLENMLAGLLNHYFDKVGRFLPLEAGDNLIPFPFVKAVSSQFLTTTDPLLLLGFAAAYLIIYCVICLKKFQTDDL